MPRAKPPKPPEPAKPAAKGKGGRPTILTPALASEFCDLIRAGNYFETVCRYLQLDESVAYDWLNWGREGREAAGNWPDAYRTFAKSLAQAEALAEVQAVASLKQAGMPHKLPDRMYDAEGKVLPGVVYGDWRATAEFLARRYRGRWAPNAKHEITGTDGGPIKTETTSRLTLDAAQSLAVVEFLQATAQTSTEGDTGAEDDDATG
jgi:hypothetical protein